MHIIFLELTLIDVVHLYTSHDSCLLDVRLRIFEANLNTLLHILQNSIKLQTTKRSQGQASNFSIAFILQVHQECIDSENGQIRVLLCIRGQVKINHFLHHQVIRS